MSKNSAVRPSALITGASAGIGAAFARRLAADGHDLIIVARRRERLEALAQQLHAEHQVTVEPLSADLTNPDDLHMVERRIAGDGALEMLVNNAGFGGYMPFVTLAADRAEELIRLHVLALTRLTRAALPGMLARGKGAIVNVSSRLSFSASLSSPPLPKRAVYAASKAYINTFTEILSDELKGTGVRVQALCPGLVRTEFHEIVGADLSRLPPDAFMSPADLVHASLAGLRLGEVICVPALDDPELIAQSAAARSRLMQNNVGSLASRYRA